MKMLDYYNAKQRMDKLGDYIASLATDITTEKYNGIYVCYHSHYDLPTFSLWYKTSEDTPFEKGGKVDWLVSTKISNDIEKDVKHIVMELIANTSYEDISNV